ncbi:SHOCT domain-containing protein [Aminipila sp.]
MENNSTVEFAPIASAADEIKKYKELLDLGAISNEEFEAKKKQLLNI